MDHINNGSYHLKAKTMKQFKSLKDSKLIENKHYLKATDSPVPRCSGQPKMLKSGVPICSIVLYSGSPLYNLKK